jgi:hypothetical protein
MENLLTKLFESQDQLMNNFNLGFASGVAFALLVILGLMLLRIITIFIFRTKRTHCITIKRPEGDTEVSKNAVVSVIRSFGGDFKCIDVKKIDVFKRRAKYFLKLKINFDTANGGSPEQERLLRKRIIETLDKTFGITSVCRISLKIDHATGGAVQLPVEDDTPLFITSEPASTPSDLVPAEKVEPGNADKPEDVTVETVKDEDNLEAADIKNPDPLP